MAGHGAHHHSPAHQAHAASKRSHMPSALSMNSILLSRHTSQIGWGRESHFLQLIGLRLLLRLDLRISLSFFLTPRILPCAPLSLLAQRRFQQRISSNVLTGCGWWLALNAIFSSSSSPCNLAATARFFASSSPSLSTEKLVRRCLPSARGTLACQ